MTQQSQMTMSYHTVSGVDIQATFGGYEIGALQGVSYTITREKAPVYTMGSANPRSFSRGKRGIAGSLIFVVFNQSNLIEAMKTKALFWAKKGDYINKEMSVGANLDVIPRSESEYGNATLSYAWYHDQIPPFNIVLTALTEYGAAAQMEVRGVEILNAGSGISVDDITTDENMTFICREIKPWVYKNATPPSEANLGQNIGFA